MPFCPGTLLQTALTTRKYSTRCIPQLSISWYYQRSKHRIPLAPFATGAPGVGKEALTRRLENVHQPLTRKFWASVWFAEPARFTAEVIHACTLQLCNILMLMRQNATVHMDLKPPNMFIMLDNSLKVKPSQLA
jgi:serine/threonine protein kinase